MTTRLHRRCLWVLAAFSLVACETPPAGDGEDAGPPEGLAPLPPAWDVDAMFQAVPTPAPATAAPSGAPSASPSAAPARDMGVSGAETDRGIEVSPEPAPDPEGEGGQGGDAGPSGAGGAPAPEPPPPVVEDACGGLATACETCACRLCAAEIEACAADAACQALLDCARRTGCTGIDCLGSCGPEIEAGCR